MLTVRQWSVLPLLLLIGNVQICAALDPRPAGPDCSCYRTTSDDPAVFLNRQFFDFRDLTNELLSPTIPISNGQDRGDEQLSSLYFGQGLFADSFDPASWINRPVPGSPVSVVYSQQNVYLGGCPRLSNKF